MSTVYRCDRCGFESETSSLLYEARYWAKNPDELYMNKSFFLGDFCEQCINEIDNFIDKKRDKANSA